MDWKNVWNRICLFLVNIPKTFKEAIIWFIISYLIPLLNIGIIWAIKGDNFKFTIGILSIIIVTNASFYTALYHLAFSNKKNRKTINTINIIAYVTTVVLFTVSVIEVEKSILIFPEKIFQWGTVFSFAIAFILGLISKYDEVEAESRARAKASKEMKNANFGDKNVEI